MRTATLLTARTRFHGRRGEIRRQPCRSTHTHREGEREQEHSRYITHGLYPVSSEWFSLIPSGGLKLAGAVICVPQE